MFTQRISLAAVAAGASILVSGNSLANTEVDEEITVEGEYLASDKLNSVKSPTPILDVPQSLTIVSAEQIAEQGFNSIGDIINYSPGVINTQGEGHRDALVIRGIRTTADFFIDGARDDVQYYRPLYNLEQVEILRGPNALLFGRGGTGGILNRVTKKGVVGENFIAYQAGATSFGGYNAQIDSNTTHGDRVAYRFNAMYEALEGDRDFYDGERIGVNPSFHVQLSENSVLDLSYEYLNHERFIDRGIPTGADGRPAEQLKDIVFGDPKLNASDLKANLIRAGLQHNFTDNVKANLSAFYGDYEKQYTNFYASGYDEVLTPQQVTLDGYIDTTERENIILSGNLIGELETGSIGHTLMLGFEYIDTSSDQNRYNAFWNTTQDDNEIFTIGNRLALSNGVGVNAFGENTFNDFTVDINDDTRVDLKVTSYFIQDEIELSEHLDIIIGARFDSFDIDVNNVVAAELRSRKDEEISPRLGVVLKPKENMSIYASYSESFLPRSGEQFANINGDSDQLDPDYFENTELGLKWDALNRVSLTLAVFKNEQTRADRDNLTGETFEVRGLEVKGAEIQLQGQLTEQLSLQAGFSVLEGETASGGDPRELPENTGSIWANYQPTEKIGFGLGAIYQDESLISDDSNLTLPSYTRVDAAAYFTISPKLRVQLNIENLTNEEYYPSAHSTHQVTVGEPVNASVSVRGKL